MSVSRNSSDGMKSESYVNRHFCARPTSKSTHKSNNKTTPIPHDSLHNCPDLFSLRDDIFWIDTGEVGQVISTAEMVPNSCGGHFEKWHETYIAIAHRSYGDITCDSLWQNGDKVAGKITRKLEPILWLYPFSSIFSKWPLFYHLNHLWVILSPKNYGFFSHHIVGCLFIAIISVTAHSWLWSINDFTISNTVRIVRI